MSSSHRLTVIFVSGTTRWPPLSACSSDESTSTDVNTVIDRALLRTGLSGSNVRSVQVAQSVDAAAAFCGSADNFVGVLARWIDTSSLTLFLIVCLGHDVSIQCNVGVNQWHGLRGYC